MDADAFWLHEPRRLHVGGNACDEMVRYRDRVANRTGRAVVLPIRPNRPSLRGERHFCVWGNGGRIFFSPARESYSQLGDCSTQLSNHGVGGPSPITGNTQSKG